MARRDEGGSGRDPGDEPPAEQSGAPAAGQAQITGEQPVDPDQPVEEPTGDPASTDR